MKAVAAWQKAVSPGPRGPRRYADSPDFAFSVVSPPSLGNHASLLSGYGCFFPPSSFILHPLHPFPGCRRKTGVPRARAGKRRRRKSCGWVRFSRRPDLERGGKISSCSATSRTIAFTGTIPRRKQSSDFRRPSGASNGNLYDAADELCSPANTARTGWRSPAWTARWTTCPINSKARRSRRPTTSW